VVQVKGTYGDAANLARQAAEQLSFYLAGDYAFRVEGAKTAAFELIDQLYFRTPDMVIVPMGCGTNLTSFAKGFKEYREVGFINKTPQIIGVCAEQAPSIYNSFIAGKKTAEPAKKVESIATAIAINDPIDAIKALDAIYSTAVSDNEMLKAQYLLSREEGLFVETSSAASLSALLELKKRKDLSGKRIVCILTGSGLKDPSPILRIALKPPVIYPEIKEFMALYDQEFFQGKNVTFVERDEVIFSKPPGKKELEKQLRVLFGIPYTEAHVAKIGDFIARFLQKGKSVTFADFQDIVQDALATMTDTINRKFAVLDFQVSTGKDRKAEARVTVRLNKEEKTGLATGVGPVDAVVSALRNAAGGGVAFSLPAYKVTMRSQGTDAAVNVELKLATAQKISVGKGTSPDIIQASIEAFEDAYNNLL
jgi:threonine synthase